MSCKKIKVGQLACAVAMGLIAVPSVQAQDATMSADGTTMSSSTETSMSASTSTTQPTLVSGNVLRYYVDRAGYVTAMDVQTDQGVQFVRFSPGMGQRLYSTYPVGGPVSVYVMGSSTTRYDVVSVGDRAPLAVPTMQPYLVTDAEMLDSPAYILPGSKMVTVSGRLKDLVVSDMGDVVGMVISTDKDMVHSASSSTTDANGTTVTDPATTDTAVTSTVLEPRGILVRVPRELRHIAPGYAGTERVTPLFKGANVEVTGYNEAPRFGTLSAYAQRISASAIVVNSRAVGAVGIPMMQAKEQKALFNNVDLGGSSMSAEEMRASGMGYTVYGTSNSMGGTTSMTTSTTTTTTTSSDGTTMR